MATQTTIVASVFQQESQAKRALDALKSAGFGYDQIGIATPQSPAGTTLRQDFLDLGVSDDRASYYGQEFKSGRTVVSVRPDGRDAEALNILRSNGGYDYDQRTASTQSFATEQVATSNRNLAPDQVGTYTQATTNANTQDELYAPRSLKLRAEQLNVTKERVQTGEVELHKEVVSEQQTINVPVTHEEVFIERHAVTSGQVDNTPIGEGEVIRIPVSEEQVDVTKTTSVTGEVSIGKRAVQETQQVTDTVRHEEVRVDRQGDVNVQNANGENLSR